MNLIRLSAFFSFLFFFLMKYSFRLLENIFVLIKIACGEMARQPTQVIKLNLIIISPHLVVFT